MNLFKPFATACSLGLLSLAAADQQQREAVGDDVVPVVPSRHLGLDPSTFQHNLEILRGGRSQHMEPRAAAPSFLRADVAASRHLQDADPSYLIVQMADKCTFQTTDKGNLVLKSRNFHGDTVVFSDRPFTYEYEIPTESFFENFDDTFNDDNGGKPNAAITLVQNDESKDVVVSVFVKAVVKHREDPDGPMYVYKLEQADDQASVMPLSNIMAGKDKMTYDHCSIFVDNVICPPVVCICPCVPGCPCDTCVCDS